MTINNFEQSWNNSHWCAKLNFFNLFVGDPSWGLKFIMVPRKF